MGLEEGGERRKERKREDNEGSEVGGRKEKGITKPVKEEREEN